MSGPTARALEIYESLMDLDGEARAEALDAACSGDRAVRAEVERMLAAEGSDTFLSLSSGAGAAADLAVAPSAGACIGPFTLVRRIGAGGMGVVYEAEQDVPRRRVALKMLPATLVRPGAEERFRSEIELLARLDHPGIARVLEAGVHSAADGEELPYFAMEYVRGARDLLTWSQDRPLRERVELFVEIVDAVQHGHQRGVIHRDLKRENVLVSEAGAPKVIDFGVARALDTPEGPVSGLTRSGELVGTLRSMAPEQIDGVGGADTRTDVYALGLLLYELVARRPPYELSGIPLSAVARVIREADPAPLAGLEDPVPDDLGWVVMRALEKDPGDRYASASELAADLRRFLSGAPVEARRPTRLYLLRKLVRRHRAAASAVAAVLLAIVAGTVISLVSMFRARDEAAKFRAINGVLTRMLASVRVEEGGAELKAVELLDRASADLAGEAARPDLQAPLHLTLAKSYRSLSLDARAMAAAQRALALSDHLDGTEQIEAAAVVAAGLTADDRWDDSLAFVEEWTRAPAFAGAAPVARFSLGRAGGRALMKAGEFERAVVQLSELLDEARESLGPPHAFCSLLEQSLLNAMISAGHFPEAEALARQCLESPGVAPPAVTLDKRFTLARAIALQGRHSEARGLLEELLPEIRAAFGADHSRTMVVTGDLAAAYLKTGRVIDAAPMFEAVAEFWEARKGPDHSETLIAQGNRAKALAELGDARAVDMLRATFEGRERIFGEDDPRTLKGLLAWGRQLRRSGRVAEADRALTELVERSERALPASSVDRHRGAVELATLRLAEGRADEAAALLEQAREGFRRTAGEQNVDTLLVGMNLGGSLFEAGRLDESIEVFLAVLPAMRAALGADDERICALLMSLARVRASRGENELALDRLQEVLDWTERFLPPGHIRRLRALDACGSQLLALGRAGDALPHFEELVDAIEARAQVDPVFRSSARLGLARCLVAVEQFERAFEEFQSTVELERARLGPGEDDGWLEALEAERDASRAAAGR